MQTDASVYPWDMRTRVHMGTLAHTQAFQRTHTCTRVRLHIPVPWPAPSLGSQGHFQSDGQLWLRSGDPSTSCLETSTAPVGEGLRRGRGAPTWAMSCLLSTLSQEPGSPPSTEAPYCDLPRCHLPAPEDPLRASTHGCLSERWVEPWGLWRGSGGGGRKPSAIPPHAPS